LPVRCVRHPSASAHGAAVLARAAATPGASIEELATAMSGPTTEFVPDSGQAARELAAEYLQQLEMRVAGGLGSRVVERGRE